MYSDPISATATQPGQQGGYTCPLCGRHYSDPEGKNEIPEEDWIIPALDAQAAEEDPFLAFCLALVKAILEAEKGATVEADASRFPGFLKMVFKALAQRPDVALNVRCIIDGKVTEVKVPAGFDFSNALGSKSVLTFSEIAKLVG